MQGILKFQQNVNFKQIMTAAQNSTICSLNIKNCTETVFFYDFFYILDNFTS